jgi:hypothetical protein
MTRPLKNLVPTDEEDRLWERVQGETDKQWQAFKAFRDLNPVDRTVKEAYRRHANRPEADAAPSWWYEVSHRFRWRERAHAFDQYLDRKVVETELDERVKSRRMRRAVLGSALRKIATEMQQVDITKASVAELSRFMDVVVRQLREEYDETPTQKLKVGGMQAEDGNAVPIVISYSQSKV